VIGINKNYGIVQKIESLYGMDFPSMSVELLGRKEVEELVDIILSADIFVHPSHIENSSNAICEAMLLGMPVIATCAGGTATLLEHNKDGMLIQDGDPYAMAGAIIEMKNNSKHSVQMGLNARNKALIRHDPNKIIHNIQKIYKYIINDK
jgi:glycosyltransferase involved in cell wall biosynthesis